MPTMLALRGGIVGPLSAPPPAHAPRLPRRPAAFPPRLVHQRPGRVDQGPRTFGDRHLARAEARDGPAGRGGPDNKKDTSSPPSSPSALFGATAALPPSPDESAFSNAVVTTVLVWLGAWAFGLDPWAAARTEPLGASLGVGLACGLPYAASLAAVRAALGGVWWGEVEGHGALGSLTPLRAFTFAAGVAWADTAMWRGLALAGARAWVEAPDGAPAAAAAAAAAAGGGAGGGPAAAAAAAGGDPLTLWSSAAAAAQAAAAAAAAIPGTLTPPTPLPAAWLAPFLALGLGAAAAAVAGCEVPVVITGPIMSAGGTAREGGGGKEGGQGGGKGAAAAAALAATKEKRLSFSDDGDVVLSGSLTGAPVTLRELAWAYWEGSTAEEKDAEAEGGGGGGGDGFLAGLASRLAGLKAAANEVDAALDAASPSSTSTSTSSSPAAAAAKKAKPPAKSGGFWENLLSPLEDEEENEKGVAAKGDDDDADAFGRFLAEALDETGSAPTVIPRWPREDGPTRAWVVPALVALEGAALAYEALAAHSFVAPLVTQMVGLAAVWALEVAAKRAEEGSAAGA